MSDSKNSKGGAHLSDAHLPNVDEVKSPRPRQAGSMLMASARIEVDANCRPGDPLTPVLRKHAATYAERVRTEAPEYMQQRRKRKPHGQRRVAQCERFNCSCGKQSRSDVIPDREPVEVPMPPRPRWPPGPLFRGGYRLAMRSSSRQHVNRSR